MSVTQFQPRTQAPPDDPFGFDHAWKAVVLAERLLQVATGNANAAISDLGRVERERYADAAAVALALLDENRMTVAVYVAANQIQDLGSQSRIGRLGLVQMTRDAVEAYVAALAGHHGPTVTTLAPLVALDQRGAEG